MTLSNTDLDRLAEEHAEQIRIAAAGARVRAELATDVQRKALRGVPDLPPIPDLFKTAKIMVRFADEGFKHATDFGRFSQTILWLTTDPEGQRVLKRLRAAIVEHKEDPQLAADLLKVFGGSLLRDHSTLQIGLMTDAQIIAGGGGVTGLAIPIKGDSKAKWFSGVEVAGGLVVEAGVNLLIGMKRAKPTDLTGGFYGGHAGVHIGAGLGLNVYFDTSDDLHYEGFSYSVGIGAGGGVSVLRGWELVTSD